MRPSCTSRRYVDKKYGIPPLSGGKKNLQINRDLSYKLSRLRQQQASLFLAQFMGEYMAGAEEDFEHLYDAFCLEPIICDFLYAEGRLGRLISEVQQIYGDKLDLWSENEAENSLHNRELN